MNDVTGPPAAAARKRAFGRSLGDFRIAGATTPNGLLPAEEMLLMDVARGVTSEVSDLDWKKPEDLEKLKNDETYCIRAEFLRFLILGGDAVAPVHEKGVELERAYISGALDLEGCQSVTSVLIVSSYLASSLILRDAHLRGLNLGGSRVGAIEGDRAKIDGPLFLRRGFLAEGEVRFSGAKIGGFLDCDHASFNNPGGTALFLDGAKVTGFLFLRDGFSAEGAVRLLGAEIGRNIECDGGSFKNADSFALLCHSAKVAGAVSLRNGFTAEGTIDFSSAHVRDLVDDNIARGNAGPCKLLLDGFTYERIAGRAPTDAKTRIAWLMQQREDYTSTDFRPQPFEQLSKVLAEMGHDGDARKVAMEKQRLMIPVRVRQAAPYAKPFVWLLWRLHQFTSGFGYRPIRLIFILLALWLAGAAFYYQASEAGVFAPADLRVTTSPDLIAKCGTNWTRCKDLSSLPGFYALTYSADVVLPVSDLGQRKVWTPSRRGFELSLPLGLTVPVPPGLTTHIVAVQSFLGSLGALLFGAIITGLIKKD
jgi:hypothetical protein